VTTHGDSLPQRGVLNSEQVGVLVVERGDRCGVQEGGVCQNGLGILLFG
jgi:hypothetical protein